MSCGACTYHCSTIASEICPNPDVSGIGVVVGYTVNAGIVVMIIALSYLLIFQPEMDPFQSDQLGALPRGDFKPNPIDHLVIKGIRGKFGIRPSLSNRVEEAFMKCVLYTSDLQILSGLSILISGFVQMRYCISRYHWKILVQLAWFSSLTHFGCLSFLRNYLFNHPTERTWRLFFMVIIAFMLMFALVPTGLASTTYGPLYNGKDYYGEAIICAFDQASDTYPNSMPFDNMILSIAFLAVGLFVRLSKLSPWISNTMAARVRNPCSAKAAHLLSRVRAWSKIQESPVGMKRFLIYRPLLACFLLVRVAVDLYLSMLGEILWIVISFGWGLIQLIQTRKAASGGENDWSFGQVVPMVLIGAPLLTFYQFFYSDETKFSPRSTPSEVAFELLPAPVQMEGSPPLSATTPVYGIRDEPDHDYYKSSSWFPIFAIFPIILVIQFSAYTFYIAIVGRSIFEWAYLYVLVWVVFGCICPGIGFVLFSLLFEHHKGNTAASPFSQFFASGMRTVFIVSLTLLITAGWSLLFVPPKISESMLFFIGCWAICYPATYIFLAVVLRVRNKTSQ
ncbi:hypothetical protein BCR34DRAFT_576060 [Clohesyomyces aquaticus]|uniref:Uncharacterized protein n=1 Tax=Clohesyomyces aquaticus TaxID=1231657 RepID=A0A1Y1YQ67_9PLEO|nr:hypothetical protein BCR34DRAFT_576060 [Clohesyomyces aquaticus]